MSGAQKTRTPLFGYLIRQRNLIFSTGSQARTRVTPRNSLLANRSRAQGPILPVAECRACTLAFSTYDPSASTPQKPLIKFLLLRFSLKKRAPFLVMRWAPWVPHVEQANRREQTCPRPSSGRTWESWGRGLAHGAFSLAPVQPSTMIIVFAVFLSG